MASLTLRRANWCLEISRSSRTFAVSFSTSLRPRGESSIRLRPGTSSPFRSHRQTAYNTSNSSARAAFASATRFQAQQAAAPAAPPRTPAAYTSPSKPAPNNVRPPAAANPTSNTARPPTAIPTPSAPDVQNLSDGLADQPIVLDEGGKQVDWTRSYHGLSVQPFSKETADTLLQPIPFDDVEVKPDGIIYLPEIKYRRILNKAFGPGGWGLAPRGETIVTGKAVTREYALLAHGRLVSVARGEQDYFSPDGVPTAAEGCKSNAMMRCCKDLGVASELWDPRYIRKFKSEHAKEVFVEHMQMKKRKKIWMRKDDKVSYPYQEVKSFGA